MLGWLAAASLPWLINLWSRRQHVETSWAAVDLLMAAVRERSRRLRLREWLLLALRTAILLLAALAAARPLWRQTASAGSAAERTHHVLVIDQSFSMACQADDASRFERAQRRARQIVEDAPAGDAFTIIAWAEVAENMLGRPTFDAASALAAIDSIECVDMSADLSKAIRVVHAANQAARKEFPGLDRTQTVFISDLAMNTWADALAKRTGSARNREDASVAASGWNELVEASEIVVESVDDGVRENIAITDVAIDPPAPVLDRTMTITVRLKTFGRRSPTKVDVELLLDGARIGKQSANLPPGGEATARFETRVSDPGGHVIEARIGDEADVLAIDNRRWLSTEVKRGPKVLCIADGASAAEDIARALNPRYRDGAMDGAIGVEVAATGSLATTDLSTYDAVFACNVAEFTPREQRLLARYAAGGGAVAFILGDRVRPAAYNDFFNSKAVDEAASSEPMLSVELAEQAATGEWRLDPLDYRHSIIAPFAGRSRAGLLGVRVAQYYPLDFGGDAGAPALAFTSGDPALVVGDYGLGRIAVLATDPALETRGEPWSTLAVSPSFVPLVRELFEYLSADRRGERLNRIAGEPLVPPVDASAGRGDSQWTSPDGAVTASPPDTRRRGVYTIQRPGSDARARAALAASIAVNVDPAESDLATIDAGELNRQAAVQTSAPIAADPIDYSGAVPLERYLLALAATLVLAELTVAWLLGRGWA